MSQKAGWTYRRKEATFNPLNYLLRTLFVFVFVFLLIAVPIFAAESTGVGAGMVKQTSVRTWGGSSWGDASAANDVEGAILSTVLKAKPDGSGEKILATLDREGILKIQVWNGSAWSAITQLTAQIGTINCQFQPFDIAYETTSGNAIVVYSDNSTIPKYRVFSGGSWGGELSTTITVTTAQVPMFINLVRKPGSNEIMCLVADNTTNPELWAAVWNGDTDTWNAASNPTTGAASLEPVTTYRKGTFDFAYESTSGDGLLVFGDGNDSADPMCKYWTYIGGTWTAVGDVPNIGSTVPYFIRLEADPASDRIAFAVLDSGYDLNCNVWTGAAWGTNVEVTAAAETYYMKCFDLVWESSGNRCIVVWGPSNLDTPYGRVWTTGSNWATTANFAAGPTDAQFIQLHRNTTPLIRAVII